jgi:gamma-glutamyl-gamma-aminobutyrate hydrolase PuuD
MKQPLIGIVPLVDEARESYWMLPGYMQGVEQAGGVPVMLPLTDDAAALLASIARAERKVMGPDGKVHVPASHKPSIIAPSPAYGNDGTGWYPEP